MNVYSPPNPEQVRDDTLTRDGCAEVAGRVTTKNLFKHILAVEAVMRRLARHFGEDEDRWEPLAGSMISTMKRPK